MLRLRRQLTVTTNEVYPFGVLFEVCAVRYRRIEVVTRDFSIPSSCLRRREFLQKEIIERGEWSFCFTNYGGSVPVSK